MRKIKVVVRAFAISLVFLFSGCATQTKPFIPDGIPVMEQGIARVVLVREKQLAGAGSPIVFLDVGENITPNAMMYIKVINIEDVLGKINFASTVLTGITFDNMFLWFDPEHVNPLYCGDIGGNCIKYHWLWPQKKAGSFLYGTGVIIHQDCETKLGYLADESMLNKFMDHKLQTVVLSEIPNCDIESSILHSYKQKIYIAPELNGYYALTTTPEFVSEMSDIPFAIVGYRRTITRTYEYVPIDDGEISRNIQVSGSAEVGDTLIWDRKPGIMRLGSAWWDGLGFMPENMYVEAGKTYYLRYTTRMGQRWELVKIE